MSPRKISDLDGRQALDRCVASGEVDSDTVALAVRYVLQTLAEQAPGRSVEVRVPPYGAVQAIEGTRHTRGTPPATVEMDATALIDLALGREHWPDLVDEGRIHASGERSDLRDFFPLWPLG